MQRKCLSPGPEVGVVREAGEAEVVALVRQRVGDLGPPARPHQEHYLVVAVVLREWTLRGEEPQTC